MGTDGQNEALAMLRTMSIAELNEFAEQYFSRLPDWDFQLSKPFVSFDETPSLLIRFAMIIQGLSLTSGMTVLDFGAGSCWTSHCLSRLGCQVIALDVSPTALRIGQELYARYPLIGNKPLPTFQQFDGHRIDLPDASVDRILCFDAFHHVPNPAEVLAELSRVLKDGGIIGFAEPGPSHSLAPQSQHEMRIFKVVENDVDLKAIWKQAREVGFTDLRVAVFNKLPFIIGLSDFDEFLQDQKPAGVLKLLRGALSNGLRNWRPTSRRYVNEVREFVKNECNFFLYKGDNASSEINDSRMRQGLTARIEISPGKLFAKAGEPIIVQARVMNSGPSTWLPRSAGFGAVYLGCHVYNSKEEILHYGYHFAPLMAGEGRPVLPDETVEFEVSLPGLPAGDYFLEFDMVSDQVCWFDLNGSQQVKVKTQVV